MALTPQQQAFFRAFGYLLVPGILRDDVAWMREEFDRLLAEPDGTASTRAIVPFVDSTERLCGLLDHPRLEPVITDLMGEDFNYLASDGAFRHGDTSWHPDGTWPVGSFAKVAIYLDQLTRATGALRVIPGSHRITGEPWDAREAMRSDELWGIPQSEVPAVALEPEPGDVIVFDHNLVHGAFGGGARRMFTLNVGRAATDAAGIERLRTYLGMHIPRWAPTTHGPLMRSTATPQRYRHLAQVIEQEPFVPGLANHPARAQLASSAP